MPNFVAEVNSAFLQVFQDLYDLWDSTAMTTRLLVALLMAGLGIFMGTRAERTGTSAVLYFVAFGCFAYIVASGIALVR